MAVVPLGFERVATPVAPPFPEVVVTDVVQRNVPVYSESVWTPEGFVNADIYPKISGYLLKQNYRDGDQVHSGQLLFQIIDDREYKAALDQARGDLGQKQADYKKNQQDLSRYKPLYDQQVISKRDFDHVNQNTRASAAAVAKRIMGNSLSEMHIDFLALSASAPTYDNTEM
jgi:multidrug resistance efflux pump